MIRLTVVLISALYFISPLSAAENINYDAEVKKILKLNLPPDEAADSAYMFLVHNGATNVTDPNVYPECERVIQERLIPFEEKNECSPRTKSRTWMELGQFCSRQGREKLDDSRTAYNKALDFAKEAEDYYLQGRALSTHMVAEINWGNTEEAFRLSEEAIKAYRKAPEPSEDQIARCLYLQAMVYLELNDLKGLRKTISELEELGKTSSEENRPFVMYNHYSVAEVYYYIQADSLTGAEKARYNDSVNICSLAAIQLLESAPDLWKTSSINRVWNYYNRAVFFLEKMGAPIDSIEYYLQKALAVDHNAKKDMIQEIDISAARVRAEMWMKHNDYQRAKTILDETLVKLQQDKGINNLIHDRIDTYNLLCEIAVESGHYKDAYGYMKELSAIEKERYSDERAKAVKELEIKYETQETQLALSKSEAQRARTLIWLFAAIGLLLAAIIIFIIYANRQRRRRMQREIEFVTLRADIGRQLTEQYIEGLENERRRMASELHDGVCNDLLAIQMNISDGCSAESMLKLIDGCRESVRRISHEMMPPEFAYASLDEVVRFYLTKQSAAHEGTVNITYQSECVDAVWTDVPDAVSLEVYRIVQEAVGNAIRHSGADKISVELKLSGKNLTMTVTDNGIYKNTNKKGLGLESIRRRAHSINGSVSIDVDTTGGTKVQLDVTLQ